MTALGHTIRVAAVLTALTTMALGPGLAHAETAPPRRDVAILAVDGLMVTIGAGREEGVAIGDRVAFSTMERVDLGDGEISHERVVSLVGEVSAVSSHRARVRMGTNERVTRDMLAELTDAALTHSPWLPPPSLAQNELSVGLAIVGVIAVGAGAGALVDARYERRFGRRGFARLELYPTGAVGYTRADDTVGPNSAATFAAVGLLGWDLEYATFAAGAGVSRSTRITKERIACDGCAVETRDLGYRLGLTIAFAARLGTRDGAHIELDSALMFIVNRFEVSRIGASIQLPLSASAWLVVRGGAGIGVTGGRHAEVGARLLLRGGGHGASTYFAPMIGYVGIGERATLRIDRTTHNRPEHPSVIHGAAARVAVEHRF